MSYQNYVSRLEGGQEIHIPVNELLRILLSGEFPDGAVFTGIKILSLPAMTGTVSVDSLPAITGEVSIDQATPGTTNAVAVKNIDEDGAVYGIRHSVNRPLMVNVSHGEIIAEGNLAGHSAIRIFGYNPSVGTSWETIHHPSTLRTYLASVERLQVVSTDTDDDGAPVGNGARTITITGLDSNYDVLTEVVTMNGTTNVLTDESFLRINSVAVTTAGSTGYNEGTITISNNADNIVLEQIDPQRNASMAAAYTVPNCCTAYIVQAVATEGSSKGSEFGFWIRTFGGLWTQKRGIVLLDSNIVLPMFIPMKLPAKTDIEIRSKAILAGAIVTGGFEGWIEED